MSGLRGSQHFEEGSNQNLLLLNMGNFLLFIKRNGIRKLR
jgi:hypothetical protein